MGTRSCQLLLILVFILFTAISCNDDDGDSTDSDNDTTPELPAGTWIDYNTGLMWQKEIVDNCYGLYYTWDLAVGYCDSLELAGFTDWRLPTISELRSLVRGCEVTMTGGACGVTDECTDSDCRNDACIGCDLKAEDDKYYWPGELEGEEETANFYWSATELADSDPFVWTLGFEIAHIRDQDKENILDEGMTTRSVRTVSATNP